MQVHGCYHHFCKQCLGGKFNEPLPDKTLPAERYERTLRRSAELRALPNTTLVEIWEHEVNEVCQTSKLPLTNNVCYSTSS